MEILACFFTQNEIVLQLRCSLGFQAEGWRVALRLRGASIVGVGGFRLGLLGRGNCTSLGMKGPLQFLRLETHTHTHTYEA